MPSRDEMLETGMTQHRAGRLAEAEATYRAMLGSDPRDADALHLLGVVEDAKGAPARAVDLIGRALEIRASPRFLSNLGMALGHLDRHEEALLAYQRALQLRPDYPEALNNLGTTLEALGRPAELVADPLGPRHPPHRFHRPLLRTLRHLRHQKHSAPSFSSSSAFSFPFSPLLFSLPFSLYLSTLVSSTFL
jgi:Flp pilus assembly protein TadD